MKLPHSEERKYTFLVKTKESSKPQKQIPKRKVSFELLHQWLGHMYTRLLLDGDTTNVFQYIDIRVDPDPFCTSCQISTIKKVIDQRNLWNPRNLRIGFHGHHTSNIFHKFNKKTLILILTSWLLMLIPILQNFMERKILPLRNSWTS